MINNELREKYTKYFIFIFGKWNGDQVLLLVLDRSDDQFICLYFTFYVNDYFIGYAYV